MNTYNLPIIKLSDLKGRIRFRIDQNDRLRLILDPQLYLKSSVPDPWHFGVDPDPRINASDNGSGSFYLQDASKKLIFNTIFSAYYFLKVPYIYIIF